MRAARGPRLRIPLLVVRDAAARGIVRVLAGLGNLVDAVVFVATSYWYLFLRDWPDRVPVEPEPAERA